MNFVNFFRLREFLQVTHSVSWFCLTAVSVNSAKVQNA